MRKTVCRRAKSQGALQTESAGESESEEEEEEEEENKEIVRCGLQLKNELGRRREMGFVQRRMFAEMIPPPFLICHVLASLVFFFFFFFFFFLCVGVCVVYVMWPCVCVPQNLW
jgi:hypothetical protein